MTTGGRTDTASRIIRAEPTHIYAAFVDRDALIRWLPPAGMTGEVHLFEPRPGGRYHLTLNYGAADPEVAGRVSDYSDVVEGLFLALVPDERIVQRAEFESSDPAFAGAMTITWQLQPVPEGTRVTVTCENVPLGIDPEDHAAGFQSTLANLAAFTEGPE